MAALSFIVIATLLVICSSELIPTSPPSLSKPEPRVLINSLPRSGSTFLGQLFKRNPVSAYLYEPQRAIGELFLQDKCSNTPDEHVAQIVTQMFECNYTLLKDYMSSVAKNKTERGYLFSWDHSASLSTASRCSSQDPYKTMFAAKDIILYAPKFKWLLDSVGSLKIIWLVRDIRGFVSSWVPMKGEEFYSSWKINKRDLWAPYSNCEDSLNVDKSLIELLSNKSATPYKRMAAWWIVDLLNMRHYLSALPRTSWMLVRYEDMSLEPIQTAKSIYEFLGKEAVHEEVLTWIMQNTEGSTGDSDVRYGTHRNSAEMASIFKQRIPADQLREMETMAGELMDYLGYTRST